MRSTWWEVLFWVWIGSEVYIALATRTRHTVGKVQDRGTQLLLWVVIVAAMTACGWIDATMGKTMFGGAHWLKTAAVVLLAAGLAIRWTAIVSLGKAFSANVAIRETQTLKDTGLYRWVRHPSYSGLLLIFLAAGVHSRNWLGLAVAMVPTTAALLYRIHVEETALQGAFGELYRSYSSRTKRLIPGVY
ncbi:MAG TPA: isoprenylcysteine carboxylmethyltransferase family protein [Acidobacteriaceae bacterium]|jgi:protein-S-isoprenylcysteine O-methyltransferase Ste14|nr:isoprenylcysteine carboxylmethyltransferase family protein [Acidobacteriaceae bacterium]